MTVRIISLTKGGQREWPYLYNKNKTQYIYLFKPKKALFYSLENDSIVFNLLLSRELNIKPVAVIVKYFFFWLNIASSHEG